MCVYVCACVQVLFGLAGSERVVAEVKCVLAGANKSQGRMYITPVSGHYWNTHTHKNTFTHKHIHTHGKDYIYNPRNEVCTHTHTPVPEHE